MPASITRGAGSVAFAYDSEHARIRETTAAATTYILADPVSGLWAEMAIAANTGAVTWTNTLVAADGL